MSAFWLAAPFALVSAYLLDRVGIRALILTGGLLEALGAAGMAFASEPKTFYFLRFCMGVGKVVIVTPIPATAARLFPRRPGLAIAITFCGWHVGGLIMAPLTAELIASFGWRHSLVWMSMIIIILGILVAVAMLGDPRRRDVAHITSNVAAVEGIRRIGQQRLPIACRGARCYWIEHDRLLLELHRHAGSAQSAVGRQRLYQSRNRNTHLVGCNLRPRSV